MSKKKPKVDEREEATLRMLKSASDWPLWPWLPVKQRTTGPGWPKMGIVSARGLHPLVIYEGDMFAPDWIEAVAKGSAVKHVYESAEEAIAAGWVVD